MIGYDALEPYIKGEDMVLEAELKTLECMPDRLATMQAQLAGAMAALDEAKLATARVVMQIKRTQGTVLEILEGVKS